MHPLAAHGNKPFIAYRIYVLHPVNVFVKTCGFATGAVLAVGE